MSHLLIDGLAKERFNLSIVSTVTTKSLYLTFIEEMEPSKIEQTHPTRNWKKVWKRLSNGVLHPVARDYLFLIIHERIYTRERAHRLKMIDSPYCTNCTGNFIASIQRKYQECMAVIESWNLLCDILEQIDRP